MDAASMMVKKREFNCILSIRCYKIPLHKHMLSPAAMCANLYK